MPSLPVAGLLADDLFLMAHDDVTGKPRLHPRVTGIGLAGALLAELTLHGRIDVRAGTVAVLDDRPVEDLLLRGLLEQVLAERQVHPVQAWLTFLAPAAPDGVAERAASAGLLVRVAQRGLRRGTRWLPADISTAAWPAARLRMLLVKGEPMRAADVTLTGLAQACGLTQQLLWDTPPRTRQYLDYVVSALAAPLRELIAETEGAVGNAVLSRRV